MVPDLYGRSWMWLVVMMFPIVGLLLIWSAAAQTIRLMRTGEITIRLSPTQPRLGEDLTVHATFTKQPSAGEHVFTLLCEQVDARGDSNRYRTVWQQERTTRPGGTYATSDILAARQLAGVRSECGCLPSVARVARLAARKGSARV